MKRTLFFFLFLIGLGTTSFSQSYGPFEWDILRIGYVIPGGAGSSGGFSFGTEPRYNINDNISASLRLEFALFGSENDASGVDLGAAGSFTAFGDYYFSNKGNKRAFAGLGIGLFSGPEVTLTVNGTETSSDGSSGIGFVPRIGYELGILRISGEYNIAIEDSISNYLGINLGFTIGGRSKK